MKKEKPLNELIDSYKPKNYKFKYIFHDDKTLIELTDMNYDLASLDTINNDTLSTLAIDAPVANEYTSDIIKGSKEPTIFDNGLVLAKKMITKVGKALLCIQIKYFEHNNVKYVGIIFKYELFDILEIFILI